MRVDGTSGPLATDVAGKGHAHSTTRRSGAEGPGECENRLISGIGGSSIPDPVKEDGDEAIADDAAMDSIEIDLAS
ncbi:hypothetical protein BHE74_00015432 [Ensete ventricosum]|nr:hypothetical protein BHE74_00015432 [Ensete ventricosum]